MPNVDLVLVFFMFLVFPIIYCENFLNIVNSDFFDVALFVLHTPFSYSCMVINSEYDNGKYIW